MDKNLIDVNLIKNSLQMNLPKKDDEIMPYEFGAKMKDLEELREIIDFINKQVKDKVKKEDNFTYFTDEYLMKKYKEKKRKIEEYNRLVEQGWIKISNKSIY